MHDPHSTEYLQVTHLSTVLFLCCFTSTLMLHESITKQRQQKLWQCSFCLKSPSRKMCSRQFPLFGSSNFLSSLHMSFKHQNKEADETLVCLSFAASRNILKRQIHLEPMHSITTNNHKHMPITSSSHFDQFPQNLKTYTVTTSQNNWKHTTSYQRQLENIMIRNMKCIH